MGTIHGGSGRNVIADEALMEIEVRGETTEINEYMSEYARNVLNGAAAVSYTHLFIRLIFNEERGIYAMAYGSRLIPKSK